MALRYRRRFRVAVTERIGRLQRCPYYEASRGIILGPERTGYGGPLFSYVYSV